MTYWVIQHGNEDAGIWYWSGYSSKAKDHMFDRDPEKAIKFFDEDSATRSGVHLTQGIHVKKISTT